MPISSLRRLFGGLFIFLILLCTPPFVLPTYAQSSVVIGEVQWAGSENSSADEWIELWNLGSAPFSLKGFRLRGVGSGSDLVFGPQAQIEPQSAFLIANYHALDSKSTLAIEAQMVSSTLSITNESTAITLLDATGTTIDEVRWDKTAPGGSNASPRSSMVRVIDQVTTLLAWTSATKNQNLISTAHQFGAPGICEGCVLDPPPAPLTPTTTPLVPPSSMTIAPEPAPETTIVHPPSIDEPLPLIPTTEQPPTTSTLSESPSSDLEQLLLDTGIDPSALGTELQKEQAPETTSEDPSESLLLMATSTEILPKIEEETPLATSTIALEDVTSSSSEQTTSSLDHLSIPSSTSALLIEMAPVGVPVSSTTPETTTTAPVIPSFVLTPEATFSTPIFLPQTGAYARFSEIYPAPTKGPEWIELHLDSPLRPSDLSGWSIRNAEKTLFTIRPTTLSSWNEEKRLLVFPFTSGKLPNKGAHLLLIDVNGNSKDDLLVPSIPKNGSFAILSDRTWQRTATPTPGTENTVTSFTVLKPIVAQKKATPVKGPAPHPPAKTTLVKEPSSLTMPVKTPVKRIIKKKSEVVTAAALSLYDEGEAVTSPPLKNTAASQAKTVTRKSSTSVKKIVPKKKTKTTKKKTAAKTNAEPQMIDLKTLGPMHASTRVRLVGTVATLPRLLGSNTFVIQTDDGRGLYVSGNSKQTSPPFRANISLTGTLSLNDDGLILHMYASDRWKLLELERAVQPHLPDLDHPSLEDAWSYVQLRGIVSNVSPTRITILHGTAEISVSIRPLVHYRSERLKKGDEIEVSGLLDTRKDTLTLLPRLAEEIRMIKTAPIATTEAMPGTRAPLPWTPVGVAGMSIAATQGVRRYWKYRLEQKIRFSKPG